MKTIILMRHSIPEKIQLPTHEIPLSNEGKKILLSIKNSKAIEGATKCFSSPYLRAVQTAEILFDDVCIIPALYERVIGDAKNDFWYQQYLDYDYKNENGESLNEVKVRMLDAIDSILNQINDNEVALVVSHATAICSYLLNYCEIKVVDEMTKSRCITYRGKEVMNGKMDPASYFVIRFDDKMIRDIVFINSCDTINN